MYQGISCAKGWVYFHESGKIQRVKLAEGQEIKGIELFAGTEIHFSATGRITFLVLGYDVRIQGVVCKRGPVEFYDSGKLKTVKLAQDQKINGVQYHENDRLTFDEDGKVTKVEYSGF